MAKFTATTKADFDKLKLLTAFNLNATVSNLSSNGVTLSASGYTAVITGHDFNYQTAPVPTGVIDSITLYSSGNLSTPIFTVTELNLTVDAAYHLAFKHGYLKTVFNSQDFVVGSNVNDVLDGFNGNDTLQGAIGNDTLDGGSGNDRLDGGNGNDALTGGLNNDTLNGGIANDWLDGGAGRDVLSGGTGNDMLIASAGGDMVMTGSGYDTIVFAGQSAIRSLTNILDYNPNYDNVMLSKDIFSRLSTDKNTFKDQFVVVSNGSKMKNDDHLLIYNKDTGDLWYDRDGHGGAAAVKIAHFEDVHGNHARISYHDFIIE